MDTENTIAILQYRIAFNPESDPRQEATLREIEQIMLKETHGRSWLFSELDGYVDEVSGGKLKLHSVTSHQGSILGTVVIVAGGVHLAYSTVAQYDDLVRSLEKIAAHLEDLFRNRFFHHANTMFSNYPDLIRQAQSKIQIGLSTQTIPKPPTKQPSGTPSRLPIVAIALLGIVVIGILLVTAWGVLGARNPDQNEALIRTQVALENTQTAIAQPAQISPNDNVPESIMPTTEMIATIPPPTPTETLNTTLIAGNNIQSIDRFEVLADVRKNQTGIVVSEGDSIHFEYVDGEWTGEQGRAGMTTGCGFYYDDPDENHVWPLPPDQRGAALIGYIGSEAFFIGCYPVDIEANTSGELYLGMSDCDGCFWDNVGALYVNISIKVP